MAKIIKGLHHVCLKACGKAKFDEVIKFYTEIIGLEVIRTWGSGKDAGAMLDLGNSILEIFANAETDYMPGIVRHIGLLTDDVDGCVEKVREAGYDILTEPKDMIIPSNPWMPIRMAFVCGPLGEEIEFFTEK